MRIAQIAPLYERTPPKLYGGTERVVHALTEELVERGHDVTLFATADSETRANLVPILATGTRLGGALDPLALHLAMLDEVFCRASEFEIIHSHVDVLTFPFARATRTPTIITMHGRLDFPEHRRVLSRFDQLPLISISESQRTPVRDLDLNWVGTVHNGVRLDQFRFHPAPAEFQYVAFLGRISPEKGPQVAIEIARRAGISIKIAAKIDPADDQWAREHFLPLLRYPGVEYLGEVDDVAKSELLSGAVALLFPINWPEPFGMVMIESMACGTPVIAFQGGAVEEVLAHGLTGYVCRSVDDAVDCLRRIDQIDRRACRSRVEHNFSSVSMAEGYEQAYSRVLPERSTKAACANESTPGLSTPHAIDRPARLISLDLMVS